MFSPRCALCKVRFPYFRASVHSWWIQILPRASPSQVLSESWFRIVINTKMLGISAQKDIFSQILLKIDHDSGQNTDTAELFNPSYTVSNCQGLSRVVNQSIWNNCTAGNCSESPRRVIQKKFWRFADSCWFASSGTGDKCSGVVGHLHQKNPT